MSKWYTEQESSTAMAAGDDFRIFRVYDNWIIRDSYVRIPTAFAASTTLDIGTAAGGTQISNAIDGTDTVTYADWAQQVVDPNDNTVTIGADGYIWLEVNVTTPTVGEIEVLLEVVAGPDQTER
jgi:hypothetical protein